MPKVQNTMSMMMGTTRSAIVPLFLEISSCFAPTPCSTTWSLVSLTSSSLPPLVRSNHSFSLASYLLIALKSTPNHTTPKRKRMVKKA